MNITKIFGKVYFSRRNKAFERYQSHAEEMQDKVMHHLVEKAEATEWGKSHNFRSIANYDDFTHHMGGINTYEELKGYIHRMREGESDVLWPGKVLWYAKSSGTTNDKSKFIPVSGDGLKDIHYAGGRDCLAAYLTANPTSRLFSNSGKSLILGGSSGGELLVGKYLRAYFDYGQCECRRYCRAYQRTDQVRRTVKGITQAVELAVYRYRIIVVPTVPKMITFVSDLRIPSSSTAYHPTENGLKYPQSSDR